MEIIDQGRTGGFLKKKNIVKGEQREGKQRKESTVSPGREFLRNRILKKHYEKSSTRRLGATKPRDKAVLEAKEAKQQYSLEGQLIKYVASAEPTPINTTQYEPNHSLTTTSHPLRGTICHNNSSRQRQFIFLHTQVDWPHSGLLVPFHAAVKAAGPHHGGQHPPSVETTKWIGQQIWGGRQAGRWEAENAASRIWALNRRI